jgi:hypothetical protein
MFARTPLGFLLMIILIMILIVLLGVESLGKSVKKEFRFLYSYGNLYLYGGLGGKQFFA